MSAYKTAAGPPAVIDNGTGYTKMGFAGNVEPQYIIPTVTASKTDVDSMKGKRDGIEDLDFFIGDKALNNSSTHQINYPIRGGIIDNWDNMERLWSRCLFEYLRCEPEDHYVSNLETLLFNFCLVIIYYVFFLLTKISFLLIFIHFNNDNNNINNKYNIGPSY